MIENIPSDEESSLSSTIDKGYEFISNMKLIEAIDLASKELNLLEDEPHLKVQFLILQGEAYVYSDQFAMATDVFFDALTIIKNNPDSSLEAKILIGLSYISRFIGDYPQSIIYATQALDLGSPIIEVKLKAQLSNGISKGKLQDFNAALLDLEKALSFSKDLNSPYYIASSLKALGDLRYHLKEFSDAHKYYKEALAVAESIEHKLLLTLIHINIGRLLIDIDENPVNNFVLAIAAAKKQNFLYGQAISYEAMSTYYGKTNNKELAYEALRKSIDLTKQNEAENKRNFYQRQLAHMSQIKDKEIELLTEISAKHQEIKDSINYAQRIQKALFPSDNYLIEHLNNAFIFHQQKDVVGGDFYWIEPLPETNHVLFAVADCTGHGVPGSLMSVVCNHALNRATREFKLRDPGEILDKTKALVIEQFEDSPKNSSPEFRPVFDGMDIAFCSLKDNMLQYAGANNPLWIVRNGELLEFKANKQPIGRFDNSVSFTTHSIDLQKGDMIYIFTDGYPDQFGGEKGKKLKAKAFKNILKEICDEELNYQQEILATKFREWKGDLEQVDDVCILGLRI